MPSAPVSERRTIPALTGVRALAAWLVFFHHVPIPWLHSSRVDLQHEMHIGVTIFYVLSGFLIAYRYEESARPTEGGWLRRYFFARFARIYPVYFALVALTLVVERTTAPLDWFLNLSLAKGLFDGAKFDGIAQSWSLTVEECFYASAPMLFVLGRPDRWLWKALLVAGAMLAAALAIGAAVGTDFLAPPRFVLLYTYFGRGFEFVCGMQLAKLLTAGALPWTRAGGRFTAAGSAGVLAVLVALTQLRGPGYDYGLYHPLGVALNNVVLPAAVASLLYGLIAERTWLARVLGSPPLVLFGQASYVFYLIHIGVLAEWWKSLGLRGFPLHFLAANAAAVAIYLGFERPVHRALRRVRAPA